MFSVLPALVILAVVTPAVRPQAQLNKFREVYAWKQLTFDIDGVLLTQDRDDPIGLNTRQRRQTDPASVNSDDDGVDFGWIVEDISISENTTTTSPRTTGTTDDANRFFIQYNNVPMGIQRVGNRLFVSIPRRRYGIPSTLNYIELDRATGRSPALKPYPDIRQAQSVVSVYRTRADSCGRLWMVDTGRLELPEGHKQVQTPVILIYDLNTNTLIRRYTLKPSDLPAEDTPCGLASIRVDITNNDCADAYAYLSDQATYGLIVYSLRQDDSWRHSHSYFYFNPRHSIMNTAGQTFTWMDGIFSLALLPGPDGCKTANFHALISTDEFSVSTCVLKNKTAMSDSNYFTLYSYVGNRGDNSQSTSHDYHPGTKVVFFAEVHRNAVSCWNSGTLLQPYNIGILARDYLAMSHPSDLNVSGDEVWVIANSLPRFGYSQLNKNDYNFFIYRANVYGAISGTICASSNDYTNRGGFETTSENSTLREN